MVVIPILLLVYKRKMTCVPWALTNLGDQPPVWLSFLGLLHDVLLLTPDERLLCRQPSNRREEIIDHGQDVGTFFKLLHSTIDLSKDRVIDQNLPDVIAPHESWKNIDELVGEIPPPEVEHIPKQIEGNDGIRNVPVVGVVNPGSEEFEEDESLGFVGLPGTWFEADHEYEACFVKTDSYVSLGVWPGCKAIYEIGGIMNNEDLVVVQLGDRRCIRKYFDLGEQVLLQGGPLSKPVQVSKNETSVQIIGVIRELISRFRDLR
jgi:SOS-response transcriptional repressor LexA